MIFPSPLKIISPTHAENDSKNWTVTARDGIFASLCFVWPDIFAQFAWGWGSWIQGGVLLGDSQLHLHQEDSVGGGGGSGLFL